jgi:hypothetical protein
MDGILGPCRAEGIQCGLAKASVWLVFILLVGAQILALRPIVRNFPDLHSATYMLAILAEGPVWAVLIEGALALSYGSKEHRRHAAKTHPQGNC